MELKIIWPKTDGPEYKDGQAWCGHWNNIYIIDSIEGEYIKGREIDRHLCSLDFTHTKQSFSAVTKCFSKEIKISIKNE